MTTATMTDNLISASEAARSLPVKTEPTTLRSWMTRGLTARDGRTVLLRSERIGGRRLTRPSWLREFLQAIAGTET
jgi:hypothetical protein